MLDFDLTDLQPYLLILVGCVLVLVAIFKKETKPELKLTGVKADGIVFALESKSNSGGFLSGTANMKDKVTIRFVTQKQEWITEDINQDFATFFTKQYKEGEAVEVYYDPNNPSTFFVNTKQSDKLGRLLFAIVGIVFCTAGIYQLL